MITSVDTSVLIDVFVKDPEHGPESAACLRRCLREGAVEACEAVWAETRAIFPDEPAFESAMKTLGIRYSPVAEKTATHAGACWKAYRKAGGARTRVMADFIIGAHAMCQADRLLTRDRGYYRAHFKGLVLVERDSPER